MCPVSSFYFFPSSFLSLHPSLFTCHFHLASLLDLALSGSPSHLPSSSLAATGWLAEMPGLCARLISTTAPTSASASPTTWGGINQSHGGRGAELQIALSPWGLKLRGEEVPVDRRGRKVEPQLYWVTTDYKQHLRSFISAVCALTQRRTGVLPSETIRPKTAIRMQ